MMLSDVICVTYVWFRFGSRHFRLLYMDMSAHMMSFVVGVETCLEAPRFLLFHVSWGRGRLKTFRQALALSDIV